jgi:hypothetical protein
MQRVALVGTIKPGKEADLWRMQEQLSSNGSKAATGFETYIGSGYFILMIDAPVADFQNRFREMFNNGPLHNLMQSIESCVSGLPTGKYATGEEARQSDGATFSSADMPMATLAARFVPGEGLQTFTEQNNRGSDTAPQASAAGSAGRRAR